MKLLLVVIAISIAPALCRVPKTLHRKKMRLMLPELMYQVGGSLQCDLCQMAVKDIQTVLAGKESQVQALAGQLCADLPQQYQQDCTTLVNEYLPLLFTLVDDMSPLEVCTLAQLCQSAEVAQENVPRWITYIRNNPLMEFLQQQRVSYLRSTIDNNYLCEGCEDVISCLRSVAASENGTIAEASAFLAQYCKYCPVVDQCQSFFQKLPDMFDQFINEYLDPQSDCQALGFCPAERVPMILLGEAEQRNQLTTVEPIMEPESEEQEDISEEIAREYRKLKGLSKIFSKKAHRIGGKVNKFSRRPSQLRFRRAINIITNRIDIDTQENERVPYDVIEENEDEVMAVPQQAKCEICSYFASAAEGVLVYNHDEVSTGLTELFTDICDALPTQFQDKCTSEVVDTAPEVIIQALTTFIAPDTLCSKVFTVCASAEDENQ